MIPSHAAPLTAAVSRTASAQLTAAAAVAVLAMLAASCATVVMAPPGVEAIRLLPAGAAAYARLDKATIAELLAALPGYDAGSVAPLADRTDSMTAAFVRPAGQAAPGVVAVANGRYPAGAASLRLSSDRSWRRNGKVWQQVDGTLNLAFADGGRAFLGTVPLDGVLAAAAAPNRDPIPARWAEAWSSEVAVFIPDPMALLAGRVPIGDGEVPMVAMVLSARPAAGGYSASLSFEFGSERAALVFSPLCRIFLYAAAHSLWPERAATVTDTASWKIDGTVVSASGIPLDAASLAAFVGLAGP